MEYIYISVYAHENLNAYIEANFVDEIEQSRREKQNTSRKMEIELDRKLFDLRTNLDSKLTFLDEVKSVKHKRLKKLRNIIGTRGNHLLKNKSEASIYHFIKEQKITETSLRENECKIACSSKRTEITKSIKANLLLVFHKREIQHLIVRLLLG